MIKTYEELENDEYIKNIIAQGDAKYNLVFLKEPVDNYPNFNLDLKLQLITIGFQYIRASEILKKNENYNWRNCLEKAAKCIFYSIYSDDDKTDNYYILLGSLCFYYSGQYSKAFVFLKKFIGNSPLNKLISYFLKKDFKNLLNQINLILLDNKILDLENSEKIYNILLAESFAYFLEYIFEGEIINLEKAIERIGDILTLSKIDEDPSIYWIFKVLKSLIINYSEESLWNLIVEYPQLNNTNFNTWIKGQAYKKNPILELFISQKKALIKSLNNDGAVICLPTSSGKTKIAEITILEKLTNNPNSLIFYIAPFKSLAHEIEEDFINSFGILGYKITRLYGDNSFNYEEKISSEDANIIIATPEKLKALIRSNEEITERLEMVILDEGHLIGSDSRYIINELLIEELKVDLKKNNGKFLILSAMLPNPEIISKWISGVDSALEKTDWSPTSQRMGILNCKKNNVDIFWKDEINSFNKNYLTPFIPKGKRKEYPSKKRQGVLYTAKRLSEFGSVLIFVPQKKSVLPYGDELYKIFYKDLEDFDWEESISWKKFKLLCKEEYGENSKIYTFAKKGIICHHGKLPTELRICIENMLKIKTPPIIIATSTLSQGVNIGVSYVIISGVYQNYLNLIKKRDFLNTAGRAGRAFVDIEGKVLLAIDYNKLSSEKKLIEKYIYDKNLEEIKSGIISIIKEIYSFAKTQEINQNYLLELIANNDYLNFENLKINFEDKLEIIDDTLLSLKYKYEILNSTKEWEEDHFKTSLAYLEVSHPFILEFIKARSKGLENLIPNREKWQSYIQTSIPLKTSIYIDDEINNILEIIDFYINNKQENLLIAISKLELIMNKFPSKKFKNPEIEDQDLIKELWLKGESYKKIIEKSNEKFVENIINNYLKYNFSWAINSISRRLHYHGYLEESKVLEEIVKLVQYGLPDLNSLNIYLAGINSRFTSIEISKIINEISFSDYIELFENKLGTFEIYEIKKIFFDKNKYKILRKYLTKNSKYWIELLQQKERENKLEYFIKNINLDEYLKIDSFILDKLFIKKLDNEYFLTSIDYNIKIKIPVEDTRNIIDIANNLGIYFKYDICLNQLKMISRNPYLKIFN